MAKRKANKRRLTQNQQEFERQINRLEKAIKRLHREGYEIDFQLPQRPKRVTKQYLNELKNIKPKHLKEKYAVFHVTEGGYSEGKEKSRKKFNWKEWDRNVMANFLSEMKDAIMGSRGGIHLWEKFVSEVDSFVSKYGLHNVAVSINSTSADRISLFWECMRHYQPSDAGIVAYLNAVFQALPSLTQNKEEDDAFRAEMQAMIDKDDSESIEDSFIDMEDQYDW